jgi:hypothetical protein
MIVSPCRVLRSAYARIDEQRAYRESVERHECAAPPLCATLVHVLALQVKAGVRQDVITASSTLGHAA